MVDAFEMLVNKVRPLVRDGGRLVVVNNALFLSGRDFLDHLERLSQGGWMELEEIIPVPPDAAGYDRTGAALLPSDPAPFNHPTKIVVMKVRRK